ncbi:hypothetical protein GF312_20210 [Candidatus Poribacteria bacterium]|nr:hypothetical protein [Candidatus Poribacteria bacterium]
MKNTGTKKVIEIIVIIIMLFGWFAVINGGFQNADPEPGSSYSVLNPLRHGFLILLISTVIYVIISPRRTLNERLAMGIIFFGMFSLCQPFTMVLYRIGFQTLITGTLAFIVISHLEPEKKVQEKPVQVDSMI